MTVGYSGRLVLVRDGDIGHAPPSVGGRWVRRTRRIIFTVATVGLLGVFAFFKREPILQAAATAWIISDPVGQADVAVVLGGGIDVRPFEAAELYRQGLVNRVLVSHVEDERAARIGAIPGHTEANRRVLIRKGVPQDQIEIFGLSNVNTYDEAMALKDWATRHHVSTIAIPTEIFTARRLRWTMNHVFAGTSIRVSVLAFDPPKYTRRNWWRKVTGATAFPVEVVKYLAYRLSY